MGQRGSRHLVGIGEVPERGLDPEYSGHHLRGVELWGKPGMSGVYASQRLSLGVSGKACQGHAKVANRTREIRPSGMKTGASGNVTMGVGLRPVTKVAELPPDPTVRAPEFYPDNLQVRIW